MAEYMLQRYHRRRDEAIVQLGGRCKICGSTCQLEIDHIDKTKKSYSISKILASAPDARYKAELLKCQLLCKKHHIRKTGHEQSVEHGSGLTGKKSCYCKLCAPLKRAYANAWRKEKRRKERES